MTKQRSVQLSAFPDVQPNKPIGPILPSVLAGTNADLMAKVAPFYLSGSVCDVTYGKGSWWSKFRPEPFVAHDLDRDKGDGVDFTALPEHDDTYDAVVFDPPYIPQGGVDTSSAQTFRESYGLIPRNEVTLWTMNLAGLGECCRVSRRFVLVKCMDYVNSGAFNLGHVTMIDESIRLGHRVHDLIVHHAGSGPGGHNIFDPIRARRHHSYLLVIEVASP